MTAINRIFSDNRLFCLVAILGWMLLGSLFLAQAYFYSVSTGQEMDWSRQIPYRLSGYLVWGLFTVPLYFLFKTLSRKLKLTIHLLVQLLLAVVIGISHRLIGTFVEFFVRQLFFLEEATIGAFFGFRQIALIGGSLDSALTYLVLVASFFGISSIIQNQKQQQQIAQIQQQLTQSKLDTLQSQLQPHFLFNTLNGIVAAIHAAPMKAESMVSQLGRILRFSLDNSGRQTVSLEEEIAALKDYLNIEQARLGDRLTYQIEIESDAKRCRVPPLILQPIVENAVKHGITPFNRPGTINIVAKRTPDKLILSVADSGKPIFEGTDVRIDRPATGTGIGLNNCSARLQALFGNAAILKLNTSSLGGTEVLVKIPYSESNSGKSL